MVLQLLHQQKHITKLRKNYYNEIQKHVFIEKPMTYIFERSNELLSSR